KTTKVGGSGIGLPLSQLIVESHGGALAYEDQRGAARGATFRLTLPLGASQPWPVLAPKFSSLSTTLLHVTDWRRFWKAGATAPARRRMAKRLSSSAQRSCPTPS